MLGEVSGNVGEFFKANKEAIAGVATDTLKYLQEIGPSLLTISKELVSDLWPALKGGIQFFAEALKAALAFGAGLTEVLGPSIRAVSKLLGDLFEVFAWTIHRVADPFGLKDEEARAKALAKALAEVNEKAKAPLADAAKGVAKIGDVAAAAKKQVEQLAAAAEKTRKFVESMWSPGERYRGQNANGAHVFEEVPGGDAEFDNPAPTAGGARSRATRRPPRSRSPGPRRSSGCGNSPTNCSSAARRRTTPTAA